VAPRVPLSLSADGHKLDNVIVLLLVLVLVLDLFFLRIDYEDEKEDENDSLIKLSPVQRNCHGRRKTARR